MRLEGRFQITPFPAVMSVIPLTLTISLCLVFTFVVFFLRETSRRHYSSAERDALMPLAEETPCTAPVNAAHPATVAAAAAPAHAEERGGRSPADRFR